MYEKTFGELGAEVDLLSYLWDQPSAKFVNDLDGLDSNGKPNKPIQTIEVHKDFTKVNVSDYAAILMAANYCSVRLRYFVPPDGQLITPNLVEEAPAVKFFAEAMANKGIVKGALCHGLWIMTPKPALLKGREVICHEVVLADILNAGARYKASPNGVVTDGDLVTGHSIKECPQYIQAIAAAVISRRTVSAVPRCC
jgi:protease I